jgi:hypothetical protein
MGLTAQTQDVVPEAVHLSGPAFVADPDRTSVRASSCKDSQFVLIAPRQVGPRIDHTPSMQTFLPCHTVSRYE